MNRRSLLLGLLAAPLAPKVSAALPAPVAAPVVPFEIDVFEHFLNDSGAWFVKTDMDALTLRAWNAEIARQVLERGYEPYPVG